MAYAIVFEDSCGEQLLTLTTDGRYAIYSKKEDAVSSMDRMLKESTHELKGSPERYGNVFWGYKTLYKDVSEERRKDLLRFINTVQIKSPDTLRFKDGTKIKGSK